MACKKTVQKIFILLVMTVLCLGGFSLSFAMATNYNEEQSGITLYKNYNIYTASGGAYADYFIDSAAISSEYHKSYFSGGTINFGSGYMYEADKQGSTSVVRLLDEYSGEFSIAGQGFYDDIHLDNATTVADYQRLAFIFTNTANTNQYIKFSFGQSYYDYLILNAYYYDLGVQAGAIYKTTTGMNLLPSFSGKARFYNNKNIPFKFSYDIAEQVFGVSDTGSTINHNLNDFLGAELPSFDTYSVDMSFENKSQQNTAKFIVYELCGQVLAGETPVNTAGARIFVKPSHKIVADFEYTVPTPKIYDVLDGDLSEQATYRVLYGDIDVQVSGRKFMPIGSSDVYTIIYSVTDSGNIVTEKSIEVDALAFIPRNEIEFSGDIDEVYPNGSLVTVPSLKVYSGLAYEITSLPYYTLIQKDGVVLKRIDEGQERIYRINDTGRYDIVYTFFNELGVVATETKSFISENIPRFSETEIPEYVFIGREFYVPEFYLIYGDEQFLADFEVFSPTNEKIDVQDRIFVPQEKGDYTIVFTKEYNDRLYTKTCVLNSGIGAATLIENVSGVLSVEGNEDLPSYSVSGNGVKVLADSRTSTFKFVNPIDLNYMDEETNLIALQVLSGEGYASFTELIIELIDAEDPQNTVKFKYRYNQWNDTYSYVLLNYNGKSLGIRNEAGHIGEVDNYFGTVTHNSFNGYKYSNKETFAVRVNYEERQFFVREINDRFRLLLDADDPEQVGDNIWNGFKSGRVYVQVSMQTLYDVGGVIVTELGGQSLSGNVLEDNVPPNAYFEKDIHISDYSDMPQGVKGYEYKLPIVGAEDLFSTSCTIIRSLYYVGSAGDEPIEVESGVNVFTPSKTGNYKILYTVSDSYGNSKLIILHFTVEENREIEIDFETVPSAAIVGERYYIPEIVVSGSSGKAILEYSVFYNGREIKLSRNRRVYTDSVGEIKIVYRVSDYIEENISGEFVLPVGGSNYPIIEILDAMPLTVVEETVFTLPTFDVKNTGNDPSEIPLWVEVDGEILSGNSFIVTKNAGERISIVVYAGNEPYVSEKSYSVTVIKPVYLADYIVVDNTENIEKINGKFYTEIITPQDNIISLPNPIVCDDLILSFDVNDAINAGFAEEYCESVDLVLFDSVYREDRKIVITVKPDTDEKSKLILNGDNTNVASISGSFYNGNSVFYLMFDSKTKTLRDINGNLLFSVSEFENGDYFEGFSGGAAYLSFYINGVDVDKTVSLKIIQVSNQAFTSTYKKGELQVYNDTTPPVLYLGRKLYNFSTDLNSELVIPFAYSYDVLSGKQNVKITLIAPDGNKVIENADCNENISYVLNKYGTYTIRYITDNNGKNYFVEYYVKVRYKIKPEINVNGSIKEEYAVAEDIDIPDAVIVNDSREDCELFVFIQTPSARLIDITDKKQINFKEKGEYRLIYYAVDSEYNFAERIFKFTVK